MATAVVATAGCASSSTSTAQAPQQPEPYVSSPLIPLPPPSPWAVAAVAAQTVVSQVADLPCPPPNLPPELASKVDCAAMKRFADATIFVPREIVQGSLPPAVDLRAHGLSGPTKNQGSVGACAGFAVSTVLDNAARRLGRSEVVSPLHVFATYAPTDDMSRALKHHAFTLEPVWPWEPSRACRFAQEYQGGNCRQEFGIVPGSAPSDPQVLAEQRNADASGRIRIMAYEQLSADDPDQIALVLASGEAIYAGFRFNDGAWGAVNADNDRVADYASDGSEIGHAVTLEGYRWTPNGREFLFHNSWGTGWGRNGYAWMSERTLRANLGNAYRVIATDAAVPPPPSLPTFPWPALPAQLPAQLEIPPQLQGLWPAGLPRPF
ncbi:MAG: C1 family peptidase [Polyangiaceae bacterium]|nr:C1 family peptidase [Polyangiaceae bacterium]